MLSHHTYLLSVVRPFPIFRWANLRGWSSEYWAGALATLIARAVFLCWVSNFAFWSHSLCPGIDGLDWIQRIEKIKLQNLIKKTIYVALLVYKGLVITYF